MRARKLLSSEHDEGRGLIKVFLDEFVSKSSKLKLAWLHTLTSLAHNGSQIKSSEELGTHPKTVGDHIKKIETALGTEIIRYDEEGTLFGYNCDNLLLVSFPALDTIREAANLDNGSDYNDFVTFVYDLTVKDLFLFCLIVESINRKDVAFRYKKVFDDKRFPKEKIVDSTIYRNARSIEKALGYTDLIGGRSTIVPSTKALEVYEAFKQVLACLSAYREHTPNACIPSFQAQLGLQRYKATKLRVS